MQEVVSIGTSPKADMQVSGSNIAEQHAELTQKYNRTYCKALAGDEQDVTSSSYTWLDDSESTLRTGKLLTAAGCLLLLLLLWNVLSSREMRVRTICRLSQLKSSSKCTLVLAMAVLKVVSAPCRCGLLAGPEDMHIDWR